MPVNVIESFAKKSGRSEEDVEHMWNSLKRELTSKGVGGDALFAQITGIMKKQLQIERKEMKLIDRYLVTEAKEVPFEKDELKVLDKAFKRNYEGEKSSDGLYSLADDGSAGANERLFVDITKNKNGYDVDSTLSDEDGRESQGSLRFKEKDIKKVIRKIMMRI